jgi:hypothetical protein
MAGGEALPMDPAMEQFAGMGKENVKAKDILIPRLTILQSLSPQVKPAKAEYIEGAKEGDFCDTGVGELFKELVLVPCFFATIYLEWAPRDSGKGLVANYGTDDAILHKTTRDEKRRAILPNGNYVAETATFFVLNVSARGRRSFFPLASTGLRAARQWNTLLSNEVLRKADGTEFPAPLFYRSWRVRSVPISNAQGDWFAPKFEPAEPISAIDPKLISLAKEFHDQAASGLIQGDVGSQDEGAGDVNQEERNM